MLMQNEKEVAVRRIKQIKDEIAVETCISCRFNQCFEKQYCELHREI